MPATEPELFQLEEHYARKARRTRLYFGAALIAAIAITAVVAVSLSGSGNKSKAHPTALPSASAAVTAGPPTPATSMPATPPSPGSDADMTTIMIDGVTLPVSRSSGPRVITAAGLASGFAETPLGAALGAVHINARLDADFGPAIFTPTAKLQTVGGNTALISSLNSAYTQSGGTTGAPIPKSDPAAEFLGYTVVAYSTSEPVTIHIESEVPGSPARYDVATTVAWSGTDWKVVLPLPSTVAPANDPATYTAF